MDAGGVAAQESAGYKSMQKTKWMTLMGSTLAVVSSSVLYVNIVFFLFLGERGNQFHVSPYLNYLVFGVNLDSVLNDIGMFLVCGVLKKFSFTFLMRRENSTAKNNLPAGSALYVFASSAPSSVAPSEVAPDC